MKKCWTLLILCFMCSFQWHRLMNDSTERDKVHRNTFTPVMNLRWTWDTNRSDLKLNSEQHSTQFLPPLPSTITQLIWRAETQIQQTSLVSAPTLQRCVIQQNWRATYSFPKTVLLLFKRKSYVDFTSSSIFSPGNNIWSEFAFLMWTIAV